MIRAYDKTYLEDAMRNLGRMLQAGVEDCGVELNVFYAAFLASGLADRFGEGHPRYVAGCSGEELALMVIQRCGIPVERELTPDGIAGSPDAVYWTGWALAYLQWESGLSFSSLAALRVDADAVIARYPALHEADVSKLPTAFLSGLETPGAVLRRLRKAAGLTQETLAERACVSLRMVRAYEQGTQDLRRAEASSVLSLSRVLSCPQELLLRP